MKRTESKAITDARSCEFLICRDHWRAIERAWRAECDRRAVPSIVVTLRRGNACLYIDPPRAMRQEAVDLLWPLFHGAAIQRARGTNEPVPFGCSRGFCQINLARADALTLAAQASLIVRNIPDICPRRRA